MRAAIYARVSTGAQDTEAQIKALRAEAKKRAWPVVIERQEKESSRKKLPMREEIIKLALAKKVDVIMVYALDRWARGTVDGLLTVTDLYEHGIGFVTLAGFPIDLTTPEGKLQFTIAQAFAEYERDQTSRRVKAGVDAYRAEHGQWGRPATAQARKEAVLELHAKQWHPIKIASNVGISRTSVDRIIKEASQKPVEKEA